MHKVFLVSLLQKSDRQCPCAAGFRTITGRQQDCVKHVFELCVEGELRNERGQCWSETQWESYCKNRVSRMIKSVVKAL